MIVELSITLAMLSNPVSANNAPLHTIKQEYAAPTAAQAYKLCDDALFKIVDSIAAQSELEALDVVIVQATCNTTLEE